MNINRSTGITTCLLCTTNTVAILFSSSGIPFCQSCQKSILAYRTQRCNRMYIRWSTSRKSHN